MVHRLSVVRTPLATPGLPRVVPGGIFDAFAWCASDTLEWGRPTDFCLGVEPSANNPSRMVFVLRGPCAFLPCELAHLHVGWDGVGDALALAPYGIDDATDELHARGVVPKDLLWLFASDLPGLFWGLHDWAHFHNHGSFEQRAWTELQCDTAALVWLWINRGVIGLSEARWESARAAVSAVAEARFHEERVSPPPSILPASQLLGLAAEVLPLAS